jgi:hypothetical protein
MKCLFLVHITFSFSLYRTFFASSLWLLTAVPCYVLVNPALIFPFSFSLLFRLCCRICVVVLLICCPLGVYSSSHALPPLAIAFPISQPGNQPLLHIEFLGQRLHLQRQCKMPAWLSQRYATLFATHTPGVTNIHPFLRRAPSRVTRTSHIGLTATPPYFSQHCGNFTSHPLSILPISVPLRSLFDWARNCDSAFERPVLRSGLGIDLSASRSTPSLAMRSVG